ncbi:MAG: restriction endonuclease subunit S [Sphingomonadales bacterium]|nr:restriction endonuclease subunit S [Sphingomonadales bacterium]
MERRLLGDVCTLQRGFDLPVKERKPGRFPLVTSSGPTDFHSEGKVRGPGVVTGRSGSIGNVFYVEDDFWPLNTALYVKDFHGNDARYIYYLLQFFDLSRFASGAGVPTLNRNHVHDEPVWIAPDVEEQKRIVAVLDQAFAALDRARALAEANLADVEELFSAQLQIALDQMQALHGVSALGSHVDFKNGFAFKSSKFVDVGQPVVRISNIQNGTVTLEKVVYARQQDYREDLSKYLVEEGALLIAMSGATTGKIGFNKTGVTLLQNQRVGKFAKTSSINLEYLAFFLETKVAEHLDISAGAAQPNLSTKQIIEVMLPIPQKEEQARFVDRMDVAKAKCAAARSNYRKQLDGLADLRKSLLQKAFAGELT